MSMLLNEYDISLWSITTNSVYKLSWKENVFNWLNKQITYLEPSDL